ncbi:hypothetical protein [Luteibacter sp. dw_328]|uniref:hypothetical protein n=1 Tax=Luteibacter sp. dw_328 TaxID=2719796 RepID=UPI001BD27C18|nr:hypothetical protein [Luteibacter sp. dw_328]
MRHGLFCRAAFVAVSLSALPQLAVADIFDARWCANGRERSDAITTWCSVAVPNGDFLGASPPIGTETGGFRHPWESPFSWWRITPPRDHSVRDHLLPWEFVGTGEPSYAAGDRPKPGVVLNKPGDSVFQWIPVPGSDGTWDGATEYSVRVTYAPYGAGGKVGLGMKLIIADDEDEKVSSEFQDENAGTPDLPATFVARLEAPPNTRISQLGIAIGKGGDALPLLIQGVEVVETRGLYTDF